MQFFMNQKQIFKYIIHKLKIMFHLIYDMKAERMCLRVPTLLQQNILVFI